MDEAERCTKLGYIAYGNLLATGTAVKSFIMPALYTLGCTGGQLPMLADQLKKMSGVDSGCFFWRCSACQWKNEPG